LSGKYKCPSVEIIDQYIVRCSPYPQPTASICTAGQPTCARASMACRA
jgi:hypothetical protein